MLALVLNGTENWVLRSSGSNGVQFEMPLTDAPSAGTNQTLAAQTQKCSICIVNNADNYPGDCAWAFSTGGQSRLRVRMFRATKVDALKRELSSRYAAGNPVVFWYVPADESQATGLYIPIQVQGHEYRCQCLELTEYLCEGDSLETLVKSGCDKTLVLDGNYSWSVNPNNSIKANSCAVYLNASQMENYGILANAFGYSNYLPWSNSPYTTDTPSVYAESIFGVRIAKSDLEPYG